MDDKEVTRLLAILAADAAGYSRLMADNERSTMAALDAARTVFRRKIEGNQGRVIDMAGDSVLAVFQTAAGAISAALAIQQELGTHSGSEPDERRLLFRIGIHLGDVIEKSDGTVYGDGVNVAARVQTKARPGGICVSQTLYQTVKGKIAMQANFLGPQSFKNIAEPIQIWQVTAEGIAAVGDRGAAKGRGTPSKRLIAGAATALAVVAIAGGWYATRQSVPPHASEPKPAATRADARSIAVLPFTNMSDDKDAAYFADGVHEELLTQLALLGELKVVSRTSVAEYRKSPKNVRQIAAELGVGSLVEGSVRRAGNQVRVTAQLVDASTDKHVWAGSYDRELKDIFAIQSELATEIAKALKVSLAPQEQSRLARRPTDNLEAYDLFLRHQDLVNRSMGSVRIMSTIKERIELLSRAVELDPKFALAWARLAAEHSRAYGYGIDRAPGMRTKAREAMDRAFALAPSDPQIEIEAGTYYELGLHDHVRAAQSFESVLKVAPHNVDALIGLSYAYADQFRVADAVALLERAFAVDARNARVLIVLANYYRNYRHFERSLALRQLLINLRPEDLDLQATYRLVDYWRSGSWDSYDRWRSTLPSDAAQKSSRVRHADVDRALARRDFAEALRLLDIDSEDVRTLMDSSAVADQTGERALILRGQGDKTLAESTARKALRLIENELRKAPENDAMWLAKARMHALLGERNAAFSAHARSLAVAEMRHGKSGADYTYREILQLHALLGDRKEALAELARQLSLPNSRAHSLRVDVSLVSLWDDAEFQALVSDPKNNAPLPIVNGSAPQWRK